MSISNQINRITGEVSDQADLISQITTVLQNKTAGESGAVIESLSVIENGTYTAPSGVDGYSPVVVSIPTYDGSVT